MEGGELSAGVLGSLCAFRAHPRHPRPMTPFVLADRQRPRWRDPTTLEPAMVAWWMVSSSLYRRT